MSSNPILLSGVVVVSTTYNDDYIASQDCVLVFEPGGMIGGSLHGNNSKIIAPPVKIFDDNAIITGHFDVECAYPEWWGAKTHSTYDLNNVVDLNQLMDHTIEEDNEVFNSAPAIQKAFDSVFKVIQFCAGLYYVDNQDDTRDSILSLTKCKTIKLIGQGCFTSKKTTSSTLKYYGGMWPSLQTTKIWMTNMDKSLLTIRIDENERTDGTVSILGGVWSVEKCYPSINYRKPVIKIIASNKWALVMSSSIIGYNDSSNENMIQIDENTGALIVTGTATGNQNADVSQLLAQDAWGTGIKIVDTVDTPEDCSLHHFKIDGFISRLGRGVVIESSHVVAMELGGYFYRNYIPLVTLHPVLDGGKISAVIQPSTLNGIDRFYYPFLQGDLSGTFIDAFIWDVGSNRPMLDSESMENVCFGQRYMLNVRNKLPQSSTIGQLYTLDKKDVYFMASQHDWRMHDLLGNLHRGDGFEGYYHLIDNNLLDLDLRGEDVIVFVNNNSFVHDLTSAGSVFATTGLQLSFSYMNQHIINAKITIGVMIPAHYCVSDFALHLQSEAYNHFSNLKVMSCSGVLYDGSYADIPAIGDIIMPLHNAMPEKNLLLFLEFSGYVPGDDHTDRPFIVVIEGKMHAPEAYHLNSVNGAEVNGTLHTSGGATYLSGQAHFATMADLPVNTADTFVVAPGARATVGVNTRYPVEYNAAEGKWFLVDVVGDLQTIAYLDSTIGPLSVGQEIFFTDIRKPLWWDGTIWRFYDG